MSETENIIASREILYNQVVREFAITLRKPGETFYDHFKRIADSFTKGSFEKEHEVWVGVIARANGTIVKSWFNSQQDKSKIVANLRRPAYTGSGNKR